MSPQMAEAVNCWRELINYCYLFTAWMWVISVTSSSARQNRSLYTYIVAVGKSSNINHAKQFCFLGIESQTKYDHLNVFRHLFMSKHGTLSRWQPSEHAEQDQV